ncbi:MAG: histidine kinase dimerization/phospho-acceptor domain-containing protein, partial [Lachnospiraceae bacterium]
MRRALLFRFFGVLLLALAISSAISYYFIGNHMLDNNISNMQNTIHVVDYSLDYGEDIQEELIKLHASSPDQSLRISVIGIDGTVYADTETTQIQQMENHADRQEIKDAIAHGQGYANRYSDTLQKNMLYVACVSQKGDYMIRLAIPYAGILDYLVAIFPMMLVGIGIAFIISVILTFRFTDTITKPLREISTELGKVNYNEPNFHHRHYQYEELNIISNTTAHLTDEIGAHIQQIEFEKRVRQEFFSNASHELKTPITSVRGYAELLSQGFVQDEKTKQDFMIRILKEMDHMTSLIDDILMISRLETKEAEVTLSMVRMAPLLDEIFESLEPIATAYQVTLYRECEPIIIEASMQQ